MTDQFRWTANKPLNRDDPVEQGDTFEPTDAEQRAYRDLMTPVENSAGTADTDDSEDTDEESDLEEMSHDELKELAEDRGVAGEIDMRSKESILEALEG